MKGLECPNCEKQVLRLWELFIFISPFWITRTCRNCSKKVKFDFNVVIQILFSIILGVIFISFVMGLAFVGGVGYLAYDYTQNNPKFCITCHEIMIESYETWEKSEHAEIKCHSCHYMTPEYAASFSFSALKGMPEKVPPRPEGKVIVPDKYCMKCHWDAEKQHGDAGEWAYFLFPKTHVPENANKVTESRFHALHSFLGSCG